MRNEKAPRYQGRLTTWKDDQGFGFITPNGGGPAVFVHVTAFAGQRARPAGSEIVTYDLGSNGKGQPRAENVAFVRIGAARPHSSVTGGFLQWVAFGFLGLLALCVALGRLHFLVLGLYLAMSVVAFITYAVDKRKAQHNRRRISEATLHTLGVFGGWPGALVAQQVMRHKSKKQTFQSAFWSTVVLNCGALGWLLSGYYP